MRTQDDKQMTIFNARLPDEFEIRASEIRAAEFLSDFQKGDLANDIYRWALKAGIQCSIQNACQRVVMMLDGSQGSWRIYDLAQLAMIYKSERQRQHYAILPFSHLEWAANFPAAERNKILKLDMKLLDQHGGRPVSLRALKIEAHRTMSEIFTETLHGLVEYGRGEVPPNFDQGPLTIQRVESPGIELHPDLIPAVDRETFEQIQVTARQIEIMEETLSREWPALRPLLTPITKLMRELTLALSKARNGEGIPVDIQAEIMHQEK